MTTNDIKGFSEENRWLSNFWVAPFWFHGLKWPTGEHCYQCHKVLPPRFRDAYDTIELMTPGQVKRWGQKQTIRKDFDLVKVAIMSAIQQCKFEQNNDLRQKLLATGDCLIEETNNWGDTFWGVCGGEGQNQLGKIIMDVREYLRK